MRGQPKNGTTKKSESKQAGGEIKYECIREWTVRIYRNKIREVRDGNKKRVRDV